jgi:hypothetical protein
MRHVRKKFRLPRNCAVETRLAGLLLLTILRTASAGILEQSMGSRNRVGTELLYRPAAYGYSLAGRYIQPYSYSVPIAPIDCSEIPALGLPFASSDPIKETVQCTSLQEVEIRAKGSKPKNNPKLSLSVSVRVSADGSCTGGAGNATVNVRK